MGFVHRSSKDQMLVVTTHHHDNLFGVGLRETCIGLIRAEQKDFERLHRQTDIKSANLILVKHSVSPFYTSGEKRHGKITPKLYFADK